jgi:diadenosine tetraphosphatase ApaH/serine/threonine PP2A family protein phosphatase
MSDDYTALQTFRLLETNVCFVGHTHACEIFIKDNQGQIYYTKQDRLEVSDANMYIVNVGSVGQPRDGRPLAAYCIYDSQKKEIQIKRVGYDISSARKKIIDAGLPRSLGDRLIIGR